MPTLNQIYLLGHLTRDPETRQLPSGVTVVDLRIAINERIGEKDVVTYVDVSAWDKVAETCARYLRKGAAVLVDGRLQMDEWAGKDGEKRTKLKVRAKSVQFLDSRKVESGAARPVEQPKVSGKVQADEPFDFLAHDDPTDKEILPF